MEQFIYLVRCKANKFVVLATNSEQTAIEDAAKLNFYFNSNDLYYVEPIKFIYGK